MTVLVSMGSLMGVPAKIKINKDTPIKYKFLNFS